MKTLNLFIFADALGWELVKHYSVLKKATPHQFKCETLFGYSSTCDPTILTGKSPNEHGHFSFFVKCDPKDSPFQSMRYLSWIPDRIGGYHKIRNRVSRRVAKQKGYTGYFQLYSVPFRFLPYLDYTEKKDIYEPGGILGGQETIFQYWERSGKRWHRSDWRNGDEKNYAEAESLIIKGEVELMYLFTAGLDATMHRYGPLADETRVAFAEFEGRINSLKALAESKYDDVRIAIFSDHGMTETKETSDLRVRCEKLPLEYGKDYIAVWDSTMARFWFFNDAAREQIEALLKEETRGRILHEDTLKEWRCDFANHRYGELFYLLDPGVLFVPSFLNLSTVPGMHGYAPDDKDSAASWLTNFDAEQQVYRLEDIYSVMQEAADRSS